MTIVNYPVENHTISQPFGFDNTNHPKRNTFYLLFDHKHPGVDFPVPVGTLVYAAYPGIVVRNEHHRGMGNVVGIRNGNIVMLYAHLRKSSVALGQLIKQGESVGVSGETGESCTMPHLHFEMRDISKPTLKEMVFDPPFENKIKQYKNTFTYKVNNTNTTKTWKSLSKLYFGIEDYWGKIKSANKNLDYSKDEILLQNTEVLIPNY